MVIHSSFADFILFLYVHVSSADNHYDPSEMATIKTKMKNLFPADTDFVRKLYLTLREYNKFDKENLDTLIKNSFQHFSADKQDDHAKVYADISEIMSADGKVNAFETKALENLKQIIDQNH